MTAIFTNPKTKKLKTINKMVIEEINYGDFCEYNVYTQEEWSYGKGCRYPEFENIQTIKEAETECRIYKHIKY